MHGPTPLFLLFLFILQLVVAWLGYCMLMRLAPVYNRPSVKRVYWAVSLAGPLMILGGRWKSIPADFLDGIFYHLVSMAYGWTIGQIIFILFALPLLAAGWLFSRTANREAGKNTVSLSRREFLQGAAGVLPVIALGISAKGVYSASKELTIQHYELALTGFPQEHRGLKLAQISDLHIGPFFGIDKLDRTLNLLRQERPDLVVITGDLIDDLDLLAPTMQMLTGFAPAIPYGVYFCWGNHEYFRDISKIAAALKKTPIRILENRSQAITEGENPLYLLGVDYPWASNGQQQEAKRKMFFTEALRGVPKNACSLLLTHHPDFISNAFEAGIPLTLAGHTHGGQVALLGRSLLPVQYRYMRGMYRHNDQYAYVHSGTGHWLPFRLGCPAEIAIFTFYSKNV
jgi:predicted MPP superfamily phosphohydrolase